MLVCRICTSQLLHCTFTIGSPWNQITLTFSTIYSEYIRERIIVFHHAGMKSPSIAMKYKQKWCVEHGGMLAAHGRRKLQSVKTIVATILPLRLHFTILVLLCSSFRFIVFCGFFACTDWGRWRCQPNCYGMCIEAFPMCITTATVYMNIYPTSHGNRGGIKVIFSPPLAKNIIFSLVFMYKTRENMMFSCGKCLVFMLNM